MDGDEEVTRHETHELIETVPAAVEGVAELPADAVETAEAAPEHQHEHIHEVSESLARQEERELAEWRAQTTALQERMLSGLENLSNELRELRSSGSPPTREVEQQVEAVEEEVSAAVGGLPVVEQSAPPVEQENKPPRQNRRGRLGALRGRRG